MRQHSLVIIGIIIVSMLVGCGGNPNDLPTQELVGSKSATQIPVEPLSSTTTTSPTTHIAPVRTSTSIPASVLSPAEARETRSRTRAQHQSSSMFETAATRLGIEARILRKALGGPPPDVPTASKILGINQQTLREALGLPPRGRGPGRRNGISGANVTPVPLQPSTNPISVVPPTIPRADGTAVSLQPSATPRSAVPIPTPESGATSASRAVNQQYLMSFSSCETTIPDCKDPRNHEVYLAQSDDGVSWSLVPDWNVYPGSVPDVIRKGDTLYIYDRQYLTRYNLSSNIQDYHQKGPGGADRSKVVTVDGLGDAGYVDPSLIIDDQGRLVLFFMHGILGADPAQCPPGEATCLKRFDSATEVEGSDGKRFILDDGNRVTVAIGSGSYMGASDPDIFFDGSRYILYISHGTGTSVWTSPNLRGDYTHIGDLSDREGGVPAGHFDKESGQYWTYAHVNQGGVTVIRRAVHSELTQMVPTAKWGEVISAGTLGLSMTRDTGSPGFAVNE